MTGANPTTRPIGEDNLARWKKLRIFLKLLSPTTTDTAYQAERLRFVERDIGLLVKLMVWGILYYYLFLSNWFGGVNKVGELTLEIVNRFFIAYLVINVFVAIVLFFIDRLPLTLVQSVMFASNFIDGLFLAAVTLLTGGLESSVYWVFVALILRNALSFPVASLQLGLNFLIIGCYLLANVTDTAITRFEEKTISVDEATQRTNLVAKSTNAAAKAKHTSEKRSTEPVETATRSAIGLTVRDHDAQFLVMRIVLLLLLTFCGYGVQVLFDKQRQTEEEMREFILRQEQLQSTGRLAAEIAHQLKNPLGIINNAAFNLQQFAGQSNGDASQQLQIIREEVDRSDRIITELMGYAKLAEGRVEKLNITEEMDRAIQLVFPASAPGEIQVRKDYAPVLPPLLMQRNQLAEVLVNLLLNAREALQGRGHIDITAGNGDNCSVIVTIADSGPGIPPNQHARIFEPYYSTKTKGTGLGLAIVKHNVEWYGGTVKVESEPGHGAQFTLQFPARALMNLHK